MNLIFKHLRVCILLLIATMLSAGCSDPNFLDKSKIDGSILRGKRVESTDSIAQRTVLIAQNFELKNEGLQYFGLCSGVILNSTTIITAAHCVNDINNSRVIITNNVHNGNIQNQYIYKIKHSVTHENYINQDTKKIDLNFDLALLFLERPLTNQSFESEYLVSISTFNYLQNSNSFNLRPTIAGYGKNKILELTNTESLFAEPINGVLEKAQIQLENEEFSDRTILIDQYEKAGACSGDSGGPLFVHRDENLYLQGIAIAIFNTPKEIGEFDRKSCNNQSVYLNLDFHKDWLAKQIGL